MKICGISDIHGDLSVKIQPCDVLCICGDIVPLEVQVNSKKSKRWLKELFIPWCSKQPCKKVLVVGGNHDFFLWHHPLQMKEMVKEEEKIEYLLNEGYEFEGVKFFGTPLCKEFGYWAFMYPYDEQDRILDKALEEYLTDYAESNTKTAGEKLISRELKNIPRQNTREICERHLEQIKNSSERDFRF